MSDHIDETNSCWIDETYTCPILMEIRQILGVGEKYKAYELPEILRQRLEDDRGAMTIAYLQGAEDQRKKMEENQCQLNN